MYSATIKLIAVIPILAAFFLVSCSPSAKSPEELRRERDAALMDFAQHREDSLTAVLACEDSLLASAQAIAEQLSPQLHKVNNPIEPYFTVGNTSAQRPGLSPRLSPDGMLYIISSLSGAKLRHVSVSVSRADGASAATPAVQPDGERSDIVDGYETVHFIGAEVDSLARFVAENLDQPLTLTYQSGSGRSVSKPLPQEQKEAIAIASRYASAVRDAKLHAVRREAAERQLEVARTQQARLH